MKPDCPTPTAVLKGRLVRHSVVLVGSVAVARARGHSLSARCVGKTVTVSDVEHWRGITLNVEESDQLRYWKLKSTPNTIHKVVFTEIDTGHGDHIEFSTEHFYTPESQVRVDQRWVPDTRLSTYHDYSRELLSFAKPDRIAAEPRMRAFRKLHTRSPSQQCGCKMCHIDDYTTPGGGSRRRKRTS